MPLVKLGYLFIRTVAKPIASAIKSHAREHPKFRAFFTSIAQSYHRLEVRMRRRIVLRTSENDVASIGSEQHSVKPLDEQRAIDLGANFVGESVVFLVAGVVLVIDQLQARQREFERRALVESRLEELFTETNSLKGEMEKLKQQQHNWEIKNSPRPH